MFVGFEIASHCVALSGACQETGLRSTPPPASAARVKRMCHHTCQNPFLKTTFIILYLLWGGQQYVCHCVSVDGGQRTTCWSHLLSPYGSWGLNLDLQAWWQVPLPTEPSHWRGAGSCLTVLSVYFHLDTFCCCLKLLILYFERFSCLPFSSALIIMKQTHTLFAV